MTTSVTAGPACNSGGPGDAVDETLALHQFFEELLQIGVRRAPVDLRKAEIQIAQGAAHSDVRQAHVDARAERLVAQAQAHGAQGIVDLAELAIDPGLAAPAFGAAGPDGFH